MPEIKPGPTWRVNVIESERGWGSKIFETKYFNTLSDARDYANKINSKNDLPYVPDWYLYAETPVRIC